MTNTVGIVGTIQGAQQHTPTGSAGLSPTHTNAQTFTPPVESSASDSPQTISPRIVIDPIAGAITQFLNTSGQVEIQIPSAAVVAYLRAGLTSEGYGKPEEEPHSKQADSSSILA